VNPVRTCVGCRRRAPKRDLVRLVWDPTIGAVAVDRPQVLPGRGCYLHAGCGELAVRRRAVGRALRRQVDPAAVETLVVAERLA
jgi:predicted RNA-binding protein YlxR (DUF448 family)